MFNHVVACALALSLSSPVVLSSQLDRSNALEPAQARVLVDAKTRANQVRWRLFNTTVQGQPRSVVLLGEVHLAQPEDLASAQTVIDRFKFLGTENGETSGEPSWDYKTMPIAGVMFVPMGIFLVLAEGAMPESPMDHAKSETNARVVHNAEQLHVPTVIEEVGLLVMGGSSLVPFVVSGSFALMLLRMVFRRKVGVPMLKFGRTFAWSALFVVGAAGFNAAADQPMLAGRDRSMAEYIDQWAHGPEAEAGPMLVIVGRAHLPGLAKLLTEQHGFTEQPIDRSLVTAPTKATVVPGAL